TVGYALVRKECPVAFHGNARSAKTELDLNGGLAGNRPLGAPQFFDVLQAGKLNTRLEVVDHLFHRVFRLQSGDHDELKRRFAERELEPLFDDIGCGDAFPVRRILDAVVSLRGSVLLLVTGLRARPRAFKPAKEG